MLEASRWRSSTAYDYLNDLGPAELAWEFLRRNPAYQEEYGNIITPAPDPETVADELQPHWGLRFRNRSAPEC